MRLLFFYSVSIVMCLLIASCGSKVSREYVHLLPDSTLTSEQADLKLKLGKMIVKNVIIKDERFVLTASKKDFVKEKIPVSYYKLLKKNMKENNSFIEENEIVGVDSMFRETIRQLKLAFDLK